jgi:hypothetical protein
LIPERLLQFEIAGNEVVPRYLTSADHLWLRSLVDEFRRFDGKRLEELRERLREPLACHVPEGKARLASHVLERLSDRRPPGSPIPPRVARRTVFSQAQRVRDGGGGWDRAAVLAAAASELATSPELLERSLLADLPRERILDLPSPVPEPHELALRVNLALAQGFLQRSSGVSLVLEGNARAVVRQVKLRRLLCTVRPGAVPGRATLELSGPYALFRRTILYGRALASLVPVLRACARFELSAEADLRGRLLRVALRSGDPIFPAAPLSRRYDSELEERFALDFQKVATDYDLVREPAPLRSGDHLIFPDFAVYHRRHPARRILIEIVGFWTPRYLKDKLERLRLVGCSEMILCIDASLNCADEDLSGPRHVIRFKRRIDARVVLAVVEKALRRRGPR